MNNVKTSFGIALLGLAACSPAAILDLSEGQYITNSPGTPASFSYSTTISTAPDYYSTTSLINSASAGTGYSFGAATGRIGDLSVEAKSSYASASGTPTWNDSQAGAFASVDDSVTVTSSTLAVGTLVSITARMGIVSSTPWPSDPNSFGYGDARLYFGSINNEIISNATTPLGSLQTTFTAKVGSTYQLYYTMETKTYTVAKDVSLDEYIHGTVTAWSSTSGVVLTSNSGYNYAPAATPEPSTWGAMGLGILGICRKRKRQI